ncbi:threonine ammonia-lyase [Helicovermis profundi]|uniref:L-threonine dehydratase catabolic TdcB n=1 Tax=Helicovermis profundi TaxID=3065157 RepID=A0AAU9E5A2_9FIRM|nr:threonine ammonia-lyase [Clostridia bacterium S502]
MEQRALKLERNYYDYLNFLNASKNLEGTIKETKLIYSEVFSKESGNEVFIKPENLQRTGAFKIRGAYNKISKLTKEERKRGVIASSAGNHAQGVAYAATKLGVLSTIVMPKTTPIIKVEATKNYGSKVVLFGDCYDEAYEEAKRLQEENDYVFVHPFDDLDVIEGQGTISLEILDELRETDYILVPVGGGGLISGIALAAKEINPSIKVIGVEPEGAMAMKESVRKNELVNLSFVDTIADGVAVKKPGVITFDIIRDYVDEIITVSDREIMEAFLLLMEKHKIVSENAGSLPFAALKKLNVWNKKVVCLLSGGNIDVVTVSTMINKGLVSRGRLFCFSVQLPDKPGELLRIADRLAKLNANVIGLDHNQFKNTDRFMNVHLEVTCETSGHEHIKQIIESLNDIGYSLEKIY